jgi:hypothetical protein
MAQQPSSFPPQQRQRFPVSFSLWHLKSLSYAPQESHALFLSAQNAIGEVSGEITRALALQKIRTTKLMVVVT